MPYGLLVLRKVEVLSSRERVQSGAIIACPLMGLARYHQAWLLAIPGEAFSGGFAHWPQRVLLSNKPGILFNKAETD